MKAFAIAIALIFALVFDAGAQKKMKPWTEWTEKEVNKMLNDSAWGQTQTETDTSEMFYTPNSQNRNPIGNRPLDGPGGSSNDRSTQGQLNQATSINYRIRLLTAKPIRQALARRAQTARGELRRRRFLAGPPAPSPLTRAPGATPGGPRPPRTPRRAGRSPRAPAAPRSCCRRSGRPG